MIDPTTGLAFSLFENRGVYALLVGSGLSSAAHIPTGWEITLDLVRRTGLLQGVTEQPDWVVWYRGQFKKEPEYSDLLNALAPTADERRAILHRYIEATPEDIEQNRKVPTKAHHAIAQLVKDGFIRVIITTNFDRLLENAIREAGVEPTVISSEDDLVGAVPLAHSRCYVIKLHGDYLDTRIRNTESELATYSAQVNQLLDRIFDEYGLIVSGWSGEWDSGLRSAITRAPSRRYPFFWTVRGAAKSTAEDIVRHRAGRFIPITDADAFWTSLAAKVAIQIDLQRADPRSVKLLTATAKKYLSRPEYRIELDDLVREELTRALDLISAENFTMSGAWGDAEFVRRVGRYEAIFEPLAKIFAVLGRWGSNEQFKTAGEVISSLADQETLGGLTGYLALRYYPAILLTYAYALGLMRAGQLGRIYSLFRLAVPDRNRDHGNLVSHYFLDVWEGGGNDVWKRLPECKGENRKTALSDHLHAIFEGWLGSEIFLPKEFGSAFEEFELLGSLAFISLNADEEALSRMSEDKTGQQWVWAPLGRIGWNGTVSQPILAKWKTPEGRRPLLDAGFADGSAVFFDKARLCLAKLMSRMSWR
jgi:hypothetical protein